MKVVALVSGGKDSCYAMMRCVDYGHEIVALANLMPMDDEVDELDSYMYQTVGHQILVKYAECMGLPLFRRRIRGSMRHQHLSYKMTSGDEVEDMFLLLKEVKQKIPCITAVSSGAIASDYQRLRVENVCSRLGLVSLSYLWKQDQTLLLDEMIRKGIVALTVKVAAMGLNPREHLGKHLTDLRDLLLQLKEQYGINVCGEGGEYETLTLDCPLFTNARIVLDEYQIVMHSVDSIAPAGVLHPLSFHLERKENSAATVSEKHDNKSMEAVSVCEVDGDSNPSQVIKHSSVDTTLKSCASKVKKLHISTTKSTFSLSSWNQSPLSKGLEENLSANLKKVESQLDEYGYGWENVLYIHLYISDMNGFALANEVYLRFITENRCFFGVPSRSCIELPLVHAGLGDSYVEVLVATDYSKKVLHVQSVSCWAPSCIGPYSQATLHKEILYMAGQLGLDPPTMNLCTGGPVAQVQKALENCVAVIRSFNSSILSGMLFVIYCSSSLTSTELCDVQCATENFLTEQASEARHEKLSNVHAPIFLYVLASALPKSADVEVKPLLYIPESSEDSTPPNIPEDGPTLKIPSAWDFGFLQLPDSCNQKFIVPGKICTSVIFITSSIAAQICSISPQTLDLSCYKLEKHIKRISKFCVYLFHRTLVEHGFSWLELMNLRVYFTISHVTIEALRNAFHETFLELADINSGIPRADDDSLFSLLPVLNSGRNANMGDLVTCELVASKL